MVYPGAIVKVLKGKDAGKLGLITDICDGKAGVTFPYDTPVRFDVYWESNVEMLPSFSDIQKYQDEFKEKIIDSYINQTI